MKMTKIVKLAIAQLALLAAPAVFADSTPPLCTLINGVYSGTYSDPTGLFPAQPFPINMYLTYKNNVIYGFTLPSNDKKGVRYGQKPFYLIWGNCTNNTVSKLYIVPNRKNTCGDSGPNAMPLPTDGSLNLTLYYENTMTSTPLKATLTPSKTNPDAATLSTGKQKELLDQAMKLGKQGIASCQ